MWTKFFFHFISIWRLKNLHFETSSHTCGQDPVRTHSPWSRSTKTPTESLRFENLVFFLFRVLHLQITRLESSSDCMFSFFFFCTKDGSQVQNDGRTPCSAARARRISQTQFRSTSCQTGAGMERHVFIYLFN